MADEIPQDQYFPRMIRWVVEESLWLNSQRNPDKGNSLSILRDTESILQTLAIGTSDSEAYSTFESELDGENTTSIQTTEAVTTLRTNRKKTVS